MLACLLASALAHAQDVPLDIPHTRFTLDNGLQVLVAEDHRVPLVAVNLWYHVGAKDEVPGRSGFAHLFEHIMFQGSRNVPEDTYFQFLEKAGAPLVNGTTDFDRTNYFETVPSNQLDLALWLESDRMGFLLDTLSQERLDNQKGVVRKERQQSTENVPYGVAEEQFFKLLFPAPHPYNGVVIGSHADLEAATLDDVKGFFTTYYTPNNATLAIVGDVDTAKARELATKYFGSIPRGADRPPLKVETTPIAAERRVALTDEVELPKVYIGWHSPVAFAEGDQELQLAASLLTGDKGSRLYTSLVKEQQVAQSVNCYQYPLQLSSVFGCEILGKPGTQVQQLEDALWAQLQAFGATMATDAELARAKTGIEAGVLRGLENLGGFGGKADVLNHYNHFLGKPGYLAEDVAHMRSVTPAQIQAAFRAVVKPESRVVVHVTPAPKAQGGAK